MIIYLEEKHKNIKELKQSSTVYSVLTLEVIKVILMMLKFGLFTTKTSLNKEPKHEKFISPKKTQMFKNTFKNFNNLFTTNIVAEKSEIEKIVQYLAVILEYDEAYFDALKDLEIKRSLNFFFLKIH